MLVRFYAVGREITGTDEREFDSTSITDLASALIGEFGERMRALLDASTLLVDGERHTVQSQRSLKPHSVVDVLPPFAGG